MTNWVTLNFLLMFFPEQIHPTLHFLLSYCYVLEVFRSGLQTCNLQICSPRTDQLSLHFIREHFQLLLSYLSSSSMDMILDFHSDGLASHLFSWVWRWFQSHSSFFQSMPWGKKRKKTMIRVMIPNKSWTKNIMQKITWLWFLPQ